MLAADPGCALFPLKSTPLVSFAFTSEVDWSYRNDLGGFFIICSSEVSLRLTEFDVKSVSVDISRFFQIQ